ITMHANYMDWVGYIDDMTRITENRFISKEESRNASLHSSSSVENPDSTFYLSKKDVASLCKFKQIPPEEIPLKIYHKTGGPIVIQFKVGNIGQADIYIMNAKK